MVVITDDSRDLPRTVFVLPKVDESALTDSDLSLVARMVEAMDPGLQRAVGFHVKSLQADKFARGLSTNVFLHAVGERLFSQGQSGLVVIELDIVHEERLELLQVAFVVGIQQRGTLTADQIVLILLSC
jgi:hypothetical protein